jgi:hypothetical protein
MLRIGKPLPHRVLINGYNKNFSNLETGGNMKKFLLMFICLNLFATIDTANISVSITSSTKTGAHQLWSDTLTWDRSANDSLLILDDSDASFEILNWDYVGLLGTYGCDSTIWYYQTANIEADFDSMTVWDSLASVDAGAGPDIQEGLTSLTPSKLIRFLIVANGAMNTLMKIDLLCIEDK